jgi:hypothetical protein
MLVIFTAAALHIHAANINQPQSHVKDITSQSDQRIKSDHQGLNILLDENNNSQCANAYYSSLIFGYGAPKDTTVNW